jgi:hypothetical protein
MFRLRGRVGLSMGVLAVMHALHCKPKVGRQCTAGQAACTDGASGLFCAKDGSYEAVSCRGRQGCQQEGARVSCDQSVAVVGDACTRPGFACASDRKSALSCQGGTFVLAQRCSGHFACRTAPFDGFAPGGSGNVLCDNDVASAGDPCLDEGDYACTVDRSVALECTGRKMVEMKRCDGPKGCSIVHPKAKESHLECDTSVSGRDDDDDNGAPN